MSRLSEKLKQVSTGTKALTKDIEARADELLHKQRTLADRTAKAFEQHHGFANEADAGITDIENALRELTNE